MRLARVAGVVVLAGAATWAVCTVTAYAAFIRGFTRFEDDTLATIHQFNPETKGMPGDHY